MSSDREWPNFGSPRIPAEQMRWLRWSGMWLAWLHFGIALLFAVGNGCTFQDAAREGDYDEREYRSARSELRSQVWKIAEESKPPIKLLTPEFSNLQKAVEKSSPLGKEVEDLRRMAEASDGKRHSRAVEFYLAAIWATAAFWIALFSSCLPSPRSG
jgi:hypothetical protein